MMRIVPLLRVLAIAAGLVAAVASATLAQAQRIALAVGVAAYRNAPPLANTRNDAQAMAAALERLGFKVETLLDPDRAALEGAIRRFGARAEGAEASLFYYAGHALEIGGRNWLLPVGAELRSALDLRFEALDLDSVLEQTTGRSRVTLMFLDACRDNPFRTRLASGARDIPTRGLGRIDAAAGTFVAFATAPGMVAMDGSGANSPFTAALLRVMERPGLEIRRLLSEVRREVREKTGGKQLPWDTSALEGDFFFRPAPGSPSEARPPGQTSATPDVEALFWDTVRNSRDPADLRAYLTRFPNGTFTELARNRLNQLQTAAATPARPPPAASAPAAPSAPAAAAPEAALRATLPPEAKEALLARLATAVPSYPAQRREDMVGRYERARNHKAQAVSLQPPGTWRVDGLDNPEAAEEIALEGCQVRWGQPCAVVAVNDRVVPGGSFSVRDMPRVRYDGHFEASRMPLISAALRQRSDIAGYGIASGPKAMALHPWRRVFVSVSAATQAVAEEQALGFCNSDASRKSEDGPCYLYAAGNHVVLPQRMIEPRRPAKSIDEAVSYVGRSSIAEAYARDPGHKALAIEVESGRDFRWTRGTSAAMAEQFALEACQLRYALPCTLIASDSTLKASDPLTAPRRDMPRLRYEGSYKPDNVPFQTDPEKNKLLRDYLNLPEPKAMAIGLAPPRLRIGSGATLIEAEGKALAACNDPDPMYPCFLYASNNRVVLPQRRTEAAR
jgi:hypothetical protein